MRRRRNSGDERVRDLERRALAGDEDAAIEWWTGLGGAGWDEAVSDLERRLESAGGDRVVTVPGHGRYLPDLVLDPDELVNRDDQMSPVANVRWMLAPLGAPVAGVSGRRFFFAHGRAPRLPDTAFEHERAAHSALVLWMQHHPDLVAVHNAKATAEIARWRSRLRGDLLDSLAACDAALSRSVVRYLKERSGLGPRRNGGDEALRDLERRAASGGLDAALEWVDVNEAESGPAFVERAISDIRARIASRPPTISVRGEVYSIELAMSDSDGPARPRWELTRSGDWDAPGGPNFVPLPTSFDDLSVAEDPSASGRFLPSLNRWISENPETVSLLAAKAAAELLAIRADERRLAAEALRKAEADLAHDAAQYLRVRGRAKLQNPQRPCTPPGSLLGRRLELPGLPEQERTVSVLADAEERAADARLGADRLLALADKLRFATFARAFGEPRAVHARAFGNPAFSISDLVRVSYADPGADFWVVRSGSDETVGRPFLAGGRLDPANHIGVRVARRDLLLPEYLYYVAEYAWRTGIYKRLCRGSLRLQHVRNEDVLASLAAVLAGRRQ